MVEKSTTRTMAKFNRIETNEISTTRCETQVEKLHLQPEEKRTENFNSDCHRTMTCKSKDIYFL